MGRLNMLHAFNRRQQVFLLQVLNCLETVFETLHCSHDR